jgi:TolB-like protein/DNA-binding winged helix-turn-helix (wHTH) protein/Flp pilus assembly protein TadD
MRRLSFGDFDLDLDTVELKLRGAPVKLERRPLDLLVLLVTRPDRLVTREEIIAALWPANVIIDFDSGLNTLVRKVRNALGDSSETPKFIATVPGRGYRFIAPVVAVTKAAPVARPAHARSAWISAMLAVLVAASAALLVWRGVEQSEPSRIAVLPFENFTGDAELTYLASGLAEDTSTTLAHIENLRVIGVSTRALAESKLQASEIGRRLGVDFVVLSSLRLDQTRLRVTSRLLRVDDGEQVWSAAFDRELTNVLGLQRELSIAIAEQIRLRLSPDVAAAIDRRQTQNPAAYALYLKGRYEWTLLTPSSMRRSLGYFEQATVEDPDYALAWAGLAFALATSLRTADTDPAAVEPLALDALRRAQQLGPDLAETQYARGYYSLFREGDARAAEKAARLAIELDPNNAQAHMLLGVTLPHFGEYVEAREMMRRARELDPMFALIFANSANIALQAGDPTGALEFGKQAIAVNPEFWVGHFHLGNARRALGDLEGAVQAYADAARLSDGHSLTYTARVSILVGLGRMADAEALLTEMTARAALQYVPPLALAVANAQLGETDTAFAWLDRAVAVRNVGLGSLATDPRLRSLHDDPRFEDLLRRCGCVAEADSLR